MSDEIDIQRTSTNRLIHEKSPYLLQHADNPVDWYPWCEEAFEKAERKDKPIFLSIGYATCHWCHVMAHESFEDDNVAALLKKGFIAIKVDREERPDIDAIYMSVCQTLTGQGGWPLSVFLTPEGKPFFAGTYFPKLSRMGMSGFMDILKQLANMWQSDREKINNASEQIMNAIQPRAGNDSTLDIIGPDILNKGYLQLHSRFDTKWGGFGEKPKFPTPHNLSFLLRYYLRSNEKNALNMAEMTLKAMRNGGIYDHIGFGFHRYSVDERWMVPHFEKMLYDQALLAIAYIEAYQVTGKTRYADVADEIFSYVLRDMTSPEGGFYSAEDADSEGKEGIFYVWTPDAIKEHLGEDEGSLFCEYFDVKEGGNFEEGLSIPNTSISVQEFIEKEGIDSGDIVASLEKMRRKLFHVRERRVHPLKDDKILTSWNGLMIGALSQGFKAIENPDYLGASKKAADCILNKLKDSQGGLLRRYREGDAGIAAYLEDYAFLVWGLVELYEATFEVQYLEEALNLNQEMIDRFWDSDNGGFYFSGKGNEPLITKTKEIYDGALPSGNSVAALNLMRLGRITGDLDLEKKAEKIVIHFSKQVREVPMAHTQLLSAIDFMVGPSREIVVVGDPDLETTREMISLIRQKYLPNKVLIFLPTGRDGERMIALAPFLKDIKPVDNLPTVYVCEHYSCKQPITQISDLEKALG